MLLLARAVAAGGKRGPSVSISDLSVNSSGFGSQEATYRLTSIGDVQSTTTGLGTVDQGDWISPKSAAGAAYECRATVLLGSLSSGTNGVWQALNVDRSWSVTDITANGIPNEAIIQVEIRLASGAVLASAEIGLTAEEF